MQPTPGNDPQLVATQYATSVNLDARIRLHAHFSTNRYGWLPWVFDQLLALPSDAAILELGCGTGELWAQNGGRIPAGWSVTLSDQSQGMLEKSQNTLVHLQHPLRFEQIDAQSIPFDDASFDAVVANHMLYHVPDLPKALAAIRRVLKPGGKLFAATNGRDHMVTLSELAGRFDERLQVKRNMVIDNFLLENGAAKLAAVFDAVVCNRYEDSLVVNEAKVLVDYILSMGPADLAQPDSSQPDQRQALADFIQHELSNAGGQITIGKSTGLFIGTKRCNRATHRLAAPSIQ